jgi:hypothetical protein
MNKRQQRALKQLHQDVQLETEQERKDHYSTTCDDDNAPHSKKRPRGHDPTMEEDLDSILVDNAEPTCPYCYQKYALAILSKHQQKCPKRDPPGKLHQTTLQFR